MIDPSTLVMEGGFVCVSASMFPVSAVIGSAGVSPTRFMMVQKPGSGTDPEWVACVWQANSSGGDPIRLVCEDVTRITRFDTQNIVLLLANGQLLTITPASGCGCGDRLKTWQPWGKTASLRQVPRPGASAA